MPALFSIGIDVEEVALGRVLRALNRTPGVAKIHFDFDRPTKSNGAAVRGDRPHGGAGKPRKGYAVTGAEFVARTLVKARSGVSSGEMSKAFLANGRGKSAASVLHTLKAQGLVDHKDDGYHATKLLRDRMRKGSLYPKSKE